MAVPSAPRCRGSSSLPTCAALSRITLLKGIEVDILEDGTLDLPQAVLSKLDLVVGAVHGKLDLPRTRQTERILAAMDNPHFTILAHPSGRLINERAASDVDMLAIVRKARSRGAAGWRRRTCGTPGRSAT